MLKNKTVILILLGFLGCAASGTPALKWAANDELNDAKRMIQSGNRRQAVDELSMLLDMKPKNDEVRLLRAVAYQGLEEFPAAVQDYETILKHDPRSAKAHYNLGMIFAFKTNEPRQALEQFDRFLTLSPEHPKAASVAKVMCSLDGGEIGDTEIEGFGEIADPAERRGKLEETLRQNPNSDKLHYLIGKTYEEEGEETQAVQAYEAALRLHPTCPPCHQALGKLLIRKGERDEGHVHLAKAKLFAK